MTIKELYEKSENIREWDVCVDSGSNKVDLSSPVIMKGIGNFAVKTVYYEAVDGGVCASIDVLTEIVTAAKNPHKNPHGHEKNTHGRLRQVTTGCNRKNRKSLGAQAFPAITHDK